MLLHIEVIVVAPACVAAGWWQATRALAGNELSWVYSVEWPIFALLAIAGWWHLVHEDPDAYRARRAPTPDLLGAEVGAGTSGQAQPAGRLAPDIGVGPATARLGTVLAILIGLESVLGVVAMLSMPFGRPSGWLPARGQPIYLAHAILGLLVGFAAAALFARTLDSTRVERIAATLGLIGVAIAGIGGLLTVDQAFARFVGIALMIVGPVVAALGYLVPSLLRSSSRASSVASG